MGASTNQSDGQHTGDALRALGTAKGSWRSIASTLYVKVLLAFVVVTLVPLAILALFDHMAIEQALTNAANRTLFAAASQTAMRLDAFVTADLGVIGTEAQLPALAGYLHLLEDKRGDSQEKARVLDILRSFTGKDEVFISSCGLLDFKGRNVIDTDGSSIDGDESGRDYFRVALETGLAYVSPVEFAPGDGKGYLYFSSAIVDSITGKPVGVLRARYGAAVLQQLAVQDNGLAGQQSHPILLDENGLVLADGLSSPGSPSNVLYKLEVPLDPARAAELAAARRLPPQPVDTLLALLPGLTDSLVRVESPEPYFSVQRAVAGVGPHAAAVARMKTRPWLVVFLEPQETLLAPAHAQARRSMALAGMILLVVAIAAIGTSRLLTGPIVRLTLVAHEVARGNLDAKAWAESDDEIGVLAEAFNSMTSRLAETMEGLRALNRELRAIRNCDQILIRATDEQTLLGDICRIVCEKAGYRMAWVGYAEFDDAKSVRAVATSGAEDGYLANANITWDDSERGRGPTGTAIRSGESACIQDFATDPKASPWRDNALLRGYRSSIALPLKDENQNTFGVLCIYSAEPNSFTTDEKSLLEELSGDLEFGIMVLRARIERKQAVENLDRLNAKLEQRIRKRTALLLRKTVELEQANERLKEIDRLKSSFLASMSHELRTPLNAVIGFSSVLLDEWSGPVNAEQKQNLASILSSGRHLLNMITDILDVTQIEAGTIKPVIEEFDLYDLLSEAEREVTAAMREKGLELRSELLHQQLRSDRRRLLQCVLNILSNAAKFTDKGSVTLEARIVSSSGETPEDEMVEIAVSDTGIGIGAEDQARIFQPFVRIDIPGRTIVPGTGLGLFLAREIATELLKGEILVSSEYDKGSRFSLRIPVRLL